MRRKTPFIIAVLYASLASAQTPEWWRSLTPNQQQAITCQVAKDKQSLENILRPLGWDKSRFPTNDWSQRYAVVIAPNRFRRGYHLGFIKERKDNTALEFRWGWVAPDDSNASEPPGKSDTVGEAHEGKEAIVIAFPKDELTRRTATCSEESLP